ncbi:PKD-like family lipoprotein [Sphingobacterium sp.]|uniref:PKD-like family lipoprotein n=1 Tax=Sphingobacterium sp. TaxID=341027 RepID=UPI0031CF1456
MNSKKYYIALNYMFLILILGACSKDKGNYNYHEINRIITKDQDGSPIDGKEYLIRQGNSKLLVCSVSNTLNQAKQRVDFTWIINGDTVSHTDKLLIAAHAYPAGRHTGKLLVKDLQTSITTSDAFTIVVIKSVGLGSYILTENNLGESTLVMRSLLDRDSFLYQKNFENITLGKKPVNIDISYALDNNGTRKYKCILITTSEGDYPMMILDFFSLRPNYTYSATKAVISGETLRPTFSVANNAWTDFNQHIFDGLVLINGKCHNILAGLISGDVFPNDTLNYHFGNTALVTSSPINGYRLAGFDYRNQAFRIFFNSNLNYGLFNYSVDFPFNTKELKNHHFIAGSASNIFWVFITHSDNEIFRHLIYLNSYQLITSAPKTIPEVVDGINFTFINNYWYFAKGRVIYRLSSQDLSLTPFITLPADHSGDIVAWDFNLPSDATTKVGIATFAPQASAIHKGSYYLYDLTTNKFEQKLLGVIDKAVDLAICL